jgi:multidrug efflux pump subunit AcrA (membrane-fusion protein)
MKKIIPVLIVAAVAAGISLKVRDGGAFRYAGTVEATETDLSARVGGVIESYGAREGEAVKKGQTVASLDCADIKLAADIAARDFDRAEELYKAGSVSRENYDRLKYRRDDTALKAGWCSVKSPVDGRLLYAYRE